MEVQMLTKIRMVSALIVCTCSLSNAAEPIDTDVVDSASTVSSVLKSADVSAPSISSVLNSPTNNTSDGSVRVAARPKILDFGEFKKKAPKKISIPEPKLSFEKDETEDAKVEAKKIESTVDRRMQSLERSLKREEKRLESRLEELGRRREKSLEKGDVDQLERIQKAEKQAVIDYDRRIERLLAAISKSQPAPIQRSIGSKPSSSLSRSSKPSSLNGNSSFSGSRSATRRPSSRSSISPLMRQPSPLNPPIGRRGAPNWNGNSVPPKASPAGPRPSAPKPEPSKQKRRFKLWPFR